jgi:hypothetical protein
MKTQMSTGLRKKRKSDSAVQSSPSGHSKEPFRLATWKSSFFANAPQTDATQNWGQLCPTQQPKARFLDLEKATPEISKALQSLVFGKSFGFLIPLRMDARSKMHHRSQNGI